MKERKVGGYKTPKSFEAMESTEEQKALARKMFVGDPDNVVDVGTGDIVKR